MEPKRHKLDYYQSPSWFATEMLRYVSIGGTVGEPCVGEEPTASENAGGISSLLKACPQVKSVWTNDIDENKEADFHLDARLGKSWEQFPDCDWVCTNPPYGSSAAPIILNAYKKAKIGVAAFLLTSFLEPCDDRAEFLHSHSPSLILVLPRFCFRKNSYGTAWATDNATISCFVWDKTQTTQKIVVRPKNDIIGFYKNPDTAISQQRALKIIDDINVDKHLNDAKM